MTSVGIRELKANLSKTLRSVKKGARVEITEHGRAVAAIVPIAPAPNLDWAHRMVAEGKAHWNGGKPTGYLGKPIRLKPGKMLSDMVIEDRR